MPFEIVRNDIAYMQADAIVNTANPHPVVGSGVDSAMHQKAGKKLMEARLKIGEIAPGQAAATPAFGLDANIVIHTVGPVWTDGSRGEEEILASCYRNSLALAVQNHCDSIAFPLLATGNYGFPRPLALQIAVREISAFLMEHDMLVYLVVFDQAAYQLSEKLFQSVSSYIDENYIEEKTREEYRANYNRRLRDFRALPLYSSAAKEEEETVCGLPVSDGALPQQGAELDQMLESLDAGFSETLLKLMDRTGKKDSEIYKKANVDRRLFSKIKNNPEYQPRKTTAVGFALALELTQEETTEFLARAGFALSSSSKFDVIVKYFLENKNYNVFELNEVLFRFDQPLIGA